MTDTWNIVQHPEIYNQDSQTEGEVSPMRLCYYIANYILEYNDWITPGEGEPNCRYAPNGQEEKIIATDTLASLEYARIIKQPFPLGEKAISKEPATSYIYAIEILNGRFKKGEMTILQSTYYTKLYEQRLSNREVKLGQDYYRIKKAISDLEKQASPNNKQDTTWKVSELLQYLKHTNMGQI